MSLYDSSSPTPLVVQYYRNSKYMPEDTLDKTDTFQNNIIAVFLKHCWEDEQTQKLVPLSQCKIVACLAIAGIVINNTVRLTNLGNLLVDGNAIAASSCGKYLERIVQCKIINDFVAQGYGCLTLLDSEVIQLSGPAQTLLKDLPMDVPKVCVGAGSGLGECYLTPNDGDGTYTCYPSEGGHVEFAPRNEEESKLWSFLTKKFDSYHRVSVERVVSGAGLANVYEFLTNEYPDQIDTTIHNQFVSADKDEKGKIVGMNASSSGEKSLCRRAMDIMMTTYGNEVGSSAIKWIPNGGLFVTGGITPKNISFIEGEDTKFMTAYRHKGRVSPVLDRIPLYAVMVEDLGLRGVHKAAVLMMNTEKDVKERTTTKKKSSMEIAQKLAFSIGLFAVATSSLLLLLRKKRY